MREHLEAFSDAVADVKKPKPLPPPACGIGRPQYGAPSPPIGTLHGLPPKPPGKGLPDL